MGIRHGNFDSPVAWRTQDYFGFAIGVENVDFQSLVAAIHPEDRQTVQAEFHDSLAQGSGYDLEFRALRDEKGAKRRSKAEPNR